MTDVVAVVMSDPGGLNRHGVADALRAYGEELALAASAQVGGAFSGNEAADALVESSPNAFLLGVLFTQGIPAERAWAGPYLLQQRLGHLDLSRLADDPGAIAEAVARPPALHRFVHTLPGWIVAAAVRINAQYQGSADAIWSAGSHVSDVTDRLLAFEGIGEKKAVMAVGILMRHFGVPLEGAECGGVAYDVHVRRVFLRTGLADADTPEAVQTAARGACPDSPATLDLAAWLVGRESCRPRGPRCGTCRLGDVCPRLTGLTVEGVGVKRR